jgi:hypothetical protein
MTQLLVKLRMAFRPKEGQGLVEYAVAPALVAIVTIVCRA